MHIVTYSLADTLHRVFAACAYCLCPCSTLLRSAAGCGCPLGDSPFLTFHIKAYGTVQDAATCATADGGSSESPLSAEAGVIQGAIKAVTVQDGYKEVKGAVEITNYIKAGLPIDTLSDGITFLKEGQMIIRLLQDK